MTDDTKRWLEVLHAESLRYPDGALEPAGPIREAALEYARECGWLAPAQAADFEKALADAVTAHAQHETPPLDLIALARIGQAVAFGLFGSRHLSTNAYLSVLRGNPILP